MKDSVLVLGSKPNSKLPLIKVKDIYCANGAAEIGASYKKIYSDSKIISIISGREFEKNPEVQRRVLEAKPDELISKLGNIDLNKYQFPIEMKYSYFSNMRQFIFQSAFFNNHFLDVFMKEAYYEKDVIRKMVHIYRAIRHNSFIGASTGFFSILYALKKNPDSKIIISGIGMSDGSHLYNDKDRYNKRSIVDKKLLQCLKKKYISQLITTDANLSKIGNIEFWKDKTLDEK